MKTVTIEDLLSWAFVHELTKGGGTDGLANANSAWRMLQASSWGKVTAFAELMTLVDRSAGFGSSWIEQGEPHEDAVTVGRAVTNLSRFDVVIDDSWWPFGDWPIEGDIERQLAEAVVRRTIERLRSRTQVRRCGELISLVVGSAVLGREPNWEAPMPETSMVQREGKPAWFRKIVVTDELGGKHEREVDGYNSRAGRAFKGAYRRFQFADDPFGDCIGRLDRQLWSLALERLDADLRPHLVGHRLVASDRQHAPWSQRGTAGLRLVEVSPDRERKKSAAA